MLTTPVISKIIQIYFERSPRQEEEEVHSEILDEHFPRLADAALFSDALVFPDVPDTVKKVLIGFFYTRNLLRPRVDKVSSHQEICDAFELMLHLHWVGIRNRMNILKTQSLSHLDDIRKLMSDQQLKDLVSARIPSEDPISAIEWHKRFHYYEPTHVWAWAAWEKYNGIESDDSE